VKKVISALSGVDSEALAPPSSKLREFQVMLPMAVSALVINSGGSVVL
jgi:hypothetical protein